MKCFFNRIVASFITFSCIITLCIGCQNDASFKDNAFKDAIDIITTEQINIHFAYKNQPLHNDYFSMQMLMIPEDGITYSVNTFAIPVNGKMGLCVKIINNYCEITDLYTGQSPCIIGEFDETLAQQIDPKHKIPTPYTKTQNSSNEYMLWLNDLYKNASWKIQPLMQNYHIWLDDCVRLDGKPAKIEDSPIPLFELIDETTGEKFKIVLTLIYDYELLKNP